MARVQKYNDGSVALDDNGRIEKGHSRKMTAVDQVIFTATYMKKIRRDVSIVHKLMAVHGVPQQLENEMTRFFDTKEREANVAFVEACKRVVDGNK